MSFTQLTSPIPVDVIGKGKGMAFAVIDDGPEHNLIWVSALDASGEIWCAPNTSVRLRENWPLGRTRSDDEQEARASGPEPRARPEPCALSDPTPRAPDRSQALLIPDSDVEHAAFP
jgi:hypothetical protein